MHVWIGNSERLAIDFYAHAYIAFFLFVFFAGRSDTRRTNCSKNIVFEKFVLLRSNFDSRGVNSRELFCFLVIAPYPTMRF